MKKFTSMILVLSILLTLFLAGCAANTAPAGQPEAQPTTAPVAEEVKSKVITDMAGVQVEVPAEVKTVVNNWPSSNQIMILLDATEKQVAYFSVLQNPSFTWMQIVNPSILEKPSIGINNTVTAEELLKINPDLVITASDKDAAAYREAGLNAVCMMFNNFEGMEKSIIATADALGGDAPERAASYIKYLDKNIALVKERLADVKEEDKPIVYYLDGQQGKTPYLTSGNGTMQEEWITMAGGKLACDGLLKGMSKEITPEQLLSIDPDYILVGGLNQAIAYDALMKDSALSGLSAIKNGKVIRIPQGTFQWCRFGSEEALQVLWAAKTLYPDKFEDIDMKAETISFYKEFLGYDLSDKYAEAILAGKSSPEGK